jgi:hypothetical protein
MIHTINDYVYFLEFFGPEWGTEFKFFSFLPQIVIKFILK